MRKRNRCPFGRKTRNGALSLAVFAAAFVSMPAMATWMALDLDRNALERVPDLLLAGETRYLDDRLAAREGVEPVVNGLFLKTTPSADGEESGGEGGATVISAPVLATGIQVEVTGLPDSGYMARSHVVQMFRNDTGRWLDGSFRFPLPEGARLGGLEVRVDGALIKRLPDPDATVSLEGGSELQSVAYDDSRGDGSVDDGIHVGPGGLHVRVAEIEPDAVAAFVFDYSMPVVRAVGDAAQLTIPPVAMPDVRRRGEAGAHGDDFIRALAQTYLMDALPLPSVFDLLHSGRSAAVQIVLDTGMPLATLESPSHQFAAAMFDDALYRISLVGDPLKTDRPFVLRWKARSPPVLDDPAGSETGETLDSEEPPVFVPETGGISQEGRMPERLRLVGGSNAGYYYIPRVHPAGFTAD